MRRTAGAVVLLLCIIKNGYPDKATEPERKQTNDKRQMEQRDFHHDVYQRDGARASDRRIKGLRVSGGRYGRIPPCGDRYI